MRRADGDTARPPVVVPIIEDRTGRLMVLASQVKELVQDCMGYKKSNISGMKKIFQIIFGGL